MKPSSLFCYPKVFCSILFLVLMNLQYSSSAQCITNILNNPSFEFPEVETVNGNNLVGSSWGGWSTQNEASLNIIRVDGTGYSSGADNAAEGKQYVDIAGADDYPVQSFTVTTPSIFYFSGKFSTRETGPGFQDFIARVDILNSSNEIVASSNQKLMTTNVSMEIWYMMSGESATLPAGTYQYRAYVGDYGHFDDAFLCVTAATGVCSNRIPSAGFETPVQPSVNLTTSVGTSTNGWYSKNGSNINITRVDGSEYPLGPDVAYSGTQYVSLGSLNDYLVRDFTLTCSSTLNFSGHFANRPNQIYSDWTGRIDILDASGTVVASSTTQDFTSATSQETWFLLYGSSSSLPAGNYKYQISLGREGNFDEGYLCVTMPSCAVLPLVWKSFTATKEQNSVILNWITAQEQNSLNFIVQQSADGITWNDIGRVDAAGNSTDEKKYSFRDINVLNGNNYYRIQQNNADGKPSFSGVKIMKSNNVPSSFSINHNTISSGILEVRLNNPQTVGLYGSDGKLLLQRKFEAGTQLLDISRYGKGIYLLSNGQKTEKFVIQK